MSLRRALFALLVATSAAAEEPAPDPVVALNGASLRPEARPGSARWCAPGGEPCIGQESFAADVCGVIEDTAGAVGLDPGYVARLLWRESAFDPGAVSRAGAQGIAQFMPGTARLRRLADPFNPAEAVPASAAYLAELGRSFGNLGLAALAYNAGEDRAARFVAGTGGLPAETRAYVSAITGFPAEAWREALAGGPVPEPDYALDGETPFAEACLKMAERRGLPEMRPPLEPWGVIIAAQGSASATEAQVRRLLGTHGALLAGERIDYASLRVPGSPGPRFTAQIGRATRAAAETVCARLEAARAACMVLAN